MANKGSKKFTRNIESILFFHFAHQANNLDEPFGNISVPYPSCVNVINIFNLVAKQMRKTKSIKAKRNKKQISTQEMAHWLSDNSLSPPFCNRSNAATSTPAAIVSVRTFVTAAISKTRRVGSATVGHACRRRYSTTALSEKTERALRNAITSHGGHIDVISSPYTKSISQI